MWYLTFTSPQTISENIQVEINGAPTNQYFNSNIPTFWHGYLSATPVSDMLVQFYVFTTIYKGCIATFSAAWIYPHYYTELMALITVLEKQGKEALLPVPAAASMTVAQGEEVKAAEKDNKARCQRSLWTELPAGVKLTNMAE